MKSPREILTYAAISASRHLGVNGLIRTWRRRQLLIVVYHGVVSAPKDPLGYAVHVAEFERQIATLVRYFRPISIADLLDAVEGRRFLPERALLVTFDDGYQNNLTNAAPALRRHGVPAVIHVSSGYIGTERILWIEEIRLRVMHWTLPQLPQPCGQPDCMLPPPGVERSRLAGQISQMSKRLPDTERQAYLSRLREQPVSYGEDYVKEVLSFLSWEEVRRLSSLGFDIGSHTVEHPILTSLSPEAVSQEMVESKRTIEHQTGQKCVCIAYPNGGKDDFSDAVLECARQAEYNLGFLVMNRFNRGIDSPLQLMRVNIPGYMPPSVFHSRITGLQDLWR